jgi:hypothetical protein
MRKRVYELATKTYEQFLAELEKILTEDSDFTFDLDLKDGIIRISPPKYLEGYMKTPYNFYVGVDPSNDGYFDTYLNCGNYHHKEFGRTYFPEETAKKVIEWINSFFGDAIDRAQLNDFTVSNQLKDFLESCDYAPNVVKPGSPDLYIVDQYSRFYEFEFSEHNGKVLIQIVKTEPEPDENGSAIEGEPEMVYQVRYDGKDLKGVFTSILRFLKREGAEPDKW